MKYTNASELARLAGLSRERVGQLLARGDIPEAVRALIGDHPVWCIPCGAANRWLRKRDLPVPTWVLRGPSNGSVDPNVWVAEGGT